MGSNMGFSNESNEAWEHMLRFAVEHILKNEDPEKFIEIMKLSYAMFPDLFPEDVLEICLLLKSFYPIHNSSLCDLQKEHPRLI